LPLKDASTLIDFEVSFEKEKKKSVKGLYKIIFTIGEESKKALT
jgi:hypothetical protein